MNCYFCDSDCGSLQTCGECKIQGCSAHINHHNKGGTCQPWRVASVEGAGRGLFAARDISAGEVVLKDWPLVEGPLPDGGDQVCVVCLGGDEVKKCPICTLPVCKVILIFS